MTRQQRQRRELLALCEAGGVARAIDLAFQHFADFGRSEEVVDGLGAALDASMASAAVRRRFEQLRSAVHGRSVGGQAPVSDGAHRHPSPHEQGDHR